MASGKGCVRKYVGWAGHKGPEKPSKGMLIRKQLLMLLKSVEEQS